jgi:hypothetical protein
MPSSPEVSEVSSEPAWRAMVVAFFQLSSAEELLR